MLPPVLSLKGCEMNGKKELIKMWRQINKVRLLDNVSPIGREVFGIDDLTKGKDYEVFGVTWKIWSDRSREFCYILKNDAGALVLKTTKKFEVVE